MAGGARRSRAQAQPFVDLLAAEMPAGSRWELMGSWRRDAGRLGDLDVLVVRRNGSLAGFKLPASFKPDRGGEQLARGVLQMGQRRMRCDFWVCRAAGVGAMRVFLTGPANLVVNQRARARRAGLLLNQRGLWRGEHRVASSEREIFSALGMAWLEPAERERWGSPGAGAKLVTVHSRTSGPDHHVRVRGGAG